MSQVKKFIDRVRQTARSRSKTLSLSIEDAQDLSNELALLLLREAELLKEINELKSQSVTEVVIGGGTFK